MVTKDSYDKLKNSKVLKVLFLIIFGTVITGILFIFRFYFWHLFWALILYFGLFPLHNIILKYVKRRSLSSTIVILLLMGLAIVPLFYLMITAANQSYLLYQYIQKNFDPAMMNTLRESDLVRDILAFVNLTEGEVINKGMQFIEDKSLGVFSSVTAVISYPFTFTLNFLFMLIMLFFLLNNGHNISGIVYRFLPFPDDIEKEVVNRLKTVIKVLLAGNTLIMILQGLAVGIGLYVAGFSMSVLGGSIAAVLSLIPVIGTSFVWIPASVYFIFQGNYPYAVLIAVWCFGSYLALENFLKPFVLGEKLNFHPLIFFFLLLGSIQAFGLPGVIIGPLLLTLFYSLLEIYSVLNGIGEPQEIPIEPDAEGEAPEV